MTSRRHSEEVEDPLRSKWEVDVRTSDLGQRQEADAGMEQNILAWRATGIECGADQWHAATLVDKNLTNKYRPGPWPFWLKVFGSRLTVCWPGVASLLETLLRLLRR